MKSVLLTSMLLTSVLAGQMSSTRIPVKDQEITNNQAGEIFKALRAVNFEAKEVVFPIFSGRTRLAYGVSIGDGKLLAKASEVVVNAVVYTLDSERRSLRTTVEGVYSEHDLAILKVDGLKAKPAKWADATNLAEGSFLAAIRTDGEAQAMGVLSVQERSLKVEDQGFLGISMDPRSYGNGVRVESVVRGSAADDAGILPGDIIAEIKGEKVKGFFELSNRLRRLQKGEIPEVKVIRDGRSFTARPVLQGREIPETRSQRLDQMDRMSGSRSMVRGNFGNVLQSDMELEATDSGLPVVDLEGRIVGMVIARQGRISTLILPGDDIARILKEKPQPMAETARPKAVKRPMATNNRRERMQRELNEMKRMMQRLQDELNRE